MNWINETSFSTDKIPDFVKVGKFSSIATGCIFHSEGENHVYAYNKKVVFTTKWDQQHPGNPPTEIGNDVWIASGVRVLYGVKIGDGAIIGAGAVISKDVPPYAFVVGNPQQIKKFRFTQDQIDKLRKIKWWDWDMPKIEATRADMKDIDVFLSKYEHE